MYSLHTFVSSLFFSFPFYSSKDTKLCSAEYILSYNKLDGVCVSLAWSHVLEYCGKWRGEYTYMGNSSLGLSVPERGVYSV